MKNLHIEHPEDTILTGDLSVLDAFADRMNNHYSVKIDGFVRTEKWWSVTTSRHINKWLDGGTAKEVSQTYLDKLV